MYIFQNILLITPVIRYHFYSQTGRNGLGESILQGQHDLNPVSFSQKYCPCRHLIQQQARFSRGFGCGLHLPPSCFQRKAEGRFQSSRNPYEDAALFAMVRNPYDKMISKYYHEMEFEKRNVL